jgi:hypothetical protein
MTFVVASIGSQHFPNPPTPQTAAGDPVSGGAAGALWGLPGINPLPLATAGCIGTLSINGVGISNGNANGLGLLDLTSVGQKEIVQLINASLGGAVVASITPQNRIALQSATGVPIVIAGSANILAALGLTAGSTVG